MVLLLALGCGFGAPEPLLQTCGNGRVDVGEFCDPEVLWDDADCDADFEACVRCMPTCRSSKMDLPRLSGDAEPLQGVIDAGLPLPAACEATFHTEVARGLTYRTTYEGGVVKGVDGQDRYGHTFSVRAERIDGRQHWTGDVVRDAGDVETAVRDHEWGVERLDLVREPTYAGRVSRVVRTVQDERGRPRTVATGWLEGTANDPEGVYDDPFQLAQQAVGYRTTLRYEYRENESSSEWVQTQSEDWFLGVSGHAPTVEFRHPATGRRHTNRERPRKQTNGSGWVSGRYEVAFHPDGRLRERSLVLPNDDVKWSQRFDSNGRFVQLMWWDRTIAVHDPTSDAEGRPVRAVLAADTLLTANYSGDDVAVQLVVDGTPTLSASRRRQPDGSVVTQLPHVDGGDVTVQDDRGVVRELRETRHGITTVRRWNAQGLLVEKGVVGTDADWTRKTRRNDDGLPTQLIAYGGRQVFDHRGRERSGTHGAPEILWTRLYDSIGRVVEIHDATTGELAARFDYGCIALPSEAVQGHHAGVWSQRERGPLPADPYITVLNQGIQSMHEKRLSSIEPVGRTWRRRRRSRR